jgi:hypothetical protein
LYVGHFDAKLCRDGGERVAVPYLVACERAFASVSVVSAAGHLLHLHGASVAEQLVSMVGIDAVLVVDKAANGING